jgi:AcrR family transcriptional regulator
MPREQDRERPREAREARRAQRVERHTRRHERHDHTDRDARRLARREELLDAAVEVIRRDGPAVSMEVIAAEAGVTKPIVYRHFGDRSGLVAALAKRFSDDLMGTLQSSLVRDAEPRDLLVGTIDAYLAFVEREPNLYRFVVQHVDGGAEEVTGFVRRVAQEVAVVLGERLRQVGYDSGAAEPWAYSLVGMVHLAGDWWVERGAMPRARLVEYLTTLVWDGMAGLDAEATAHGSA